MRKPTIWEALTAKLGREPTNAECKAEVQRIMREGADEAMRNLAEKGKLPWQRKA